MNKAGASASGLTFGGSDDWQLGVAHGGPVGISFPGSQISIRRMGQRQRGQQRRRAEIEYFIGPHTINAKGTFAFLHKHLNWPER